MQEAGVARVEVSSSGDERVCAGCRTVNGKRFTVVDALSLMPLPGDGCDMCRCVYTAVFSSSRPPRGSVGMKQTESSTGVGCASMIALTLIVVALAVLAVVT